MILLRILDKRERGVVEVMAKKRLSIGILAHVDSGKTTLSEALLYQSGTLRSLGRVDHGNAFLDSDPIERERGITIFSKIARFTLNHRDITLLDTPGHIDFSTEMERTLSVLDYAILVVCAPDGIQSHTETLWRLLRNAHIPTLLFCNKMDMCTSSKESLLLQIQERFGQGCIDFGDPYGVHSQEQLALCDEFLMEQLLNGDVLSLEQFAPHIAACELYPVFFGSALRLHGVEELLSFLDHMSIPPNYGNSFGARVYKITTDSQGKRLTHMKITGGTLHVRDLLSIGEIEEKVNQIRFYSGEKYVACDSAESGELCAVTGLDASFAGLGLGNEPNANKATLEPILRYMLKFPDGIHPLEAQSILERLSQEDPQLHVKYDLAMRVFELQLMGEIQLTVLQHMIRERHGIDVEFFPCGVTYRESILDSVQGMGHFEPLRHYAEVRLLLEPLPQGSGIEFCDDCDEDALDRNWRRLILTHLKEREHRGVLTGSPITDIRLTLKTGRAHKKHTEGGDFRQATYRAVRQGLMQAKSILLEPWYFFTLELPPQNIGRAMTDVQQWGATCNSPETLGEHTTLTGTAPAICLMQYRTELLSYTRGKGRLSYRSAGFAPCHNTEEVLAKLAYQPLSDLDHSPDSVFCSHGAGFVVPWHEVSKHMHTLDFQRTNSEDIIPQLRGVTPGKTGATLDAELEAIFERTYGKIQRETYEPMRKPRENPSYKRAKTGVYTGQEYLLVDGYNIIFAWEELQEMAKDDLGYARDRLLHILANYQGYRRNTVIVVFDAYRVKGNTGSVSQYGNLSVIYTKEMETADTYIERVTHELCKEHRVRVATSDRLEQIIILGNGAFRVSAEELRIEIKSVEEEIHRLL